VTAHFKSNPTVAWRIATKTSLNFRTKLERFNPFLRTIYVLVKLSGTAVRDLKGIAFTIVLMWTSIMAALLRMVAGVLRLLYRVLNQPQLKRGLLLVHVVCWTYEQRLNLDFASTLTF
jgi:hypothetical protein